MAGPVTTTLLLCLEGDGCEDERVWLAEREPGVIVVLEPMRALDAFAPADGGAALAKLLEEAEYAVQDRAWARALQRLDAAEVALGAWPGTVDNATLVRLQVLRGVAESHRHHDGRHAAAFRQAHALAWATEPDARGLEEADRHALDDERRKLLTSGTGTVAVVGDARWWLDGRPVERASVDVPAGLHRLTAVLPGKLRTFVASVPVLPGREVSVTPAWAATDDAAWFMTQLAAAVDTLAADPVALGLLGDWCARHGVARLAIAEVGAVVVPVAHGGVSMGPADPLRPPMAAGETIPDPDGVPGTWEAEVQSRADAAAGSPPADASWRLREVWFDPTTRRLAGEPGPIRIMDTEDRRRFRLAGRVGWRHGMDREHATLDGVASWRLEGPWGLRGEVGAAIADEAYRFTDTWMDERTLHVAVAGSWTGPGAFAPYTLAGAEVEAPTWAGGFIEAGGAGEFDRRWVVEAGVRTSLGSAAQELSPAWGAGLALGRRW
jgi:hypothetical protein